MSARSARTNWQRASGEFLLLIVAVGLVACQTASPQRPTSAQPARLLTDNAGVLTGEEVSSLEADLVAVEERGLAQMLIYIDPSLPPGENLEAFALRAVNAWGVGHAGVDDGLVIFIFIDDRKVRIELGLGLEGVISDEAAGRVIAEIIAPPFRRGAYGEGLRDAVRELSRLLALNPVRGTSPGPN